MRNNQKGFTIIEVVITIAIGAAVMALVLNAVAGARRSQRNNARASDVNQIAAGVNQFIATRNELPEAYSDINSIVGDGLGHYTPAQINAVNSWSAAEPSPTTAGVCSDPTHTTQSACTTAGETWTPPSSIGKFEWVAGNVYATGPPDTTGRNMHPNQGKADYLMVINEAECRPDNKLPVKGGIRAVVIVYSLEGQADTICLDV